jgi:hypothetical protein
MISSGGNTVYKCRENYTNYIASDGHPLPEAAFNTIAKQNSSTNSSKKRAGPRGSRYFFVKNELVRIASQIYI